MVNVTIENTPICIRVDGDESVTVPSDEEWRVKIVANVNEYPHLELNGSRIGRIRNETPPITNYYHFDSDDTISIEGTDPDDRILITGFVTN
jgi:hypothetical protein